jgi:hypothetical protein
MYKDYEIKLNAILDSHKGVRVELKDLKTVEKVQKDLEKAVDELRKIQKKTFAKIRQAKVDLMSSGDKYTNLLSNSEKEINAFKEGAKNLGVKVNTKKYEDAIKEFESVVGMIKNYLKSIKGH